MQLQSGVKAMKKTKDLCICGIIAALYVAMTLVNPISWSFLQFRISNLLCAIPFFSKKTAPGILVGIAVANMFSPLGAIDVVFGVSAEAVAYLICVWGPLKNAHYTIKSAILSLSVAAIIGIELRIVYSSPFLISAASLFASTMIIAVAGCIMFKTNAMKRIWGK